MYVDLFREPAFAQPSWVNITACACVRAPGSVPDLYKPPLPLLSSTISASAAPGARVSAEVSSTHTQRSASKRVEGRAPLPPAFAGATMVPPGLPDPQPSEAAWPWRTAEVDWDPESMVTGQARLTKQRRGKGQRPCTRCQVRAFQPACYGALQVP